MLASLNSRRSLRGRPLSSNDDPAFSMSNIVYQDRDRISSLNAKVSPLLYLGCTGCLTYFNKNALSGIVGSGTRAVPERDVNLVDVSNRTEVSPSD